MLRLTGAMTALVTPFDANGEVDAEALRALVRWQIDEGIDGLVICGTTGESATMSAQEKLAAFRVAVDEARGEVPIIAGTGSNSTAASVQMTASALELGVDAVLAVVPYYNKPSQEGLYAHFSAVAAVGAPVVLYNVPGRTVISMTAQTVARLAEHPSVVSIKEASADLSLDTQMMSLAGDRITFLSGDDMTTFPFMMLGGHGCISVVSNLAPRLMHDLCAAAAAGDLATARALHQRAWRIGRLCFSEPSPGPAKLILSQMGRCRPELRLPMTPPEATEALIEAARREGLL
jgi:4-hydroxy-tetrahydrodipicolinate synthase